LAELGWRWFDVRRVRSTGPPLKGKLPRGSARKRFTVASTRQVCSASRPSLMANSESSSHHTDHYPASDHAVNGDDTIDLRDLFNRLGSGTGQIIALALIGLAIAGLISVTLNRVQPVATSTRVVFSFPGFERGEYPDKSKFQPDDLRAPAVVSEAIRRQGLDTSSDFQSKIRGAISIEGIVPLVPAVATCLAPECQDFCRHRCVSVSHGRVPASSRRLTPPRQRSSRRAIAGAGSCRHWSWAAWS